MTEQRDKAKFRQAIDTTLSGLTGDPLLCQRVSARTKKGEKQVKHGMSKMLVIAVIVLLCMGTVAVAVTFRYSPEVTLQKQAMEELQDKYGLTRGSLGLFTVEHVKDEEGSHVWFRAKVFLPIERVGDYHVLITDERVEANWTHDDKSSALWTSGAPESPCWGEKQLQAYLNAPDPSAWLQPYLSENEDKMDLPTVYDTLDFTVVPQKDSDISFREAQHLADAALMDVYGMAAEELAGYDHFLDSRILQCADGRRLWDVTIANVNNTFSILVDAETGEVVHIILETGGNG